MIPFRLYAYAGLALAFVALATFAGCEHRNANQARAERDAAYSERDTAVDANASNVTTIGALQKGLAEWRKLAQTPEQAAQLIAANRDKAAQTDDLRREVNFLRSKDRALPECVALLKISLESRCPGIAAGLRRLASGHEDGDRRSPGAGGEAAAGRAHGGLRAAVPLPGQRPDD